MVLTKELINEIRKRLSISGIKDTELPLVTSPFQGDETLAIVQQGENRQLSLEEFNQYLLKEGLDDIIDAKLGKGVTLNNGNIDVSISSNLAFDEMGQLYVELGDGLTSKSNKITLKIGTRGLNVDSDGLALKVDTSTGLKYDSDGRLFISLGNGLGINTSYQLYSKLGTGLSTDSKGNIMISLGNGLIAGNNLGLRLTTNFYNLLTQLTKVGSNNAGLKYTSDGLLTIDTGDGLEVRNGKLVSTSKGLDSKYQNYLDNKINEEILSKVNVNTTISPNLIEKGVNTSVTYSVNVTNTNTEANYTTASVAIQEGSTSRNTGTTSASYNKNATDTVSAGTLKAVVTLKDSSLKKEVNFPAVNAYYKVWVGVSNSAISTSNFASLLNKHESVLSSVTGTSTFFKVTVASTGQKFYLAVPTGITVPTKYMIDSRDNPADELTTSTVSYNSVSYTVVATNSLAAGSYNIYFA